MHVWFLFYDYAIRKKKVHNRVKNVLKIIS